MRGSKISYDKQSALLIREESSSNKALDIVEFLNNKNNYYIAYNFIPRTPEGRESYSTFEDKYMKGGVEKYINDDEADPHLMVDLSEFAKAIEATGFDPDDGVTMASQDIHSLIAFGTDNGNDLKKVIDICKPVNLYIFVSSWDELVSSFWSIDWVELWNEFCNDETKRICIHQTIDAIEVKSILQGGGYLTLDHSLILRGKCVSDVTREMSYAIQDGQLARVALYTGFLMDEYNMIWNTWKSLKQLPRMFANPKTYNIKPGLGLRAVVTASGPSLDSNLENLKILSEDHIIIACASSYGTLAKHGIEPNILCLLERGDFMIEQYQQASLIVPEKSARLFASTTTPSEIFSSFHNPMIYFRSQLTPTGLFADGLHQVLPYEGPQTINTGVSLACCLGFDSILLVGADLGTADISSVRSKNAVGVSPRDFPLSVKGNYIDTVFTNDLLIDGQRALEDLIQFHSTEQDLFNMSNGVFVRGFQPIHPEEYFSFLNGKPKYQEAKKRFNDWWDSSDHYSYSKFVARLRALKPRRIIFTYIQRLIEIIKSDEAWVPQKFDRIEHFLDLSSIPLNEQFAVRTLRGQVVRYCVAIYRQYLVMRKSDPVLLEQFLENAEEIFLNRLAMIQVELFELIDQLDNED